MQRLLRIAQQRKLDRVAAAYGVAAWLAVQAASIALPTFDAPAWVLKILIIAAILGFPLALWIAWHVTPLPHQDYGAAPSYRPADIVLLVLMTAIVFLTVAELCFQFGIFTGASKPASAVTESASQTPSASEASVAVLPFTNMSGDASKDYFSDGISEELLNQLANVSELHVAARTSSFAFKGKDQDIRKIARALNVRTVVEGSVREDGQHIRITAQLINASDGYHIWSKTYDRDLSNILSLQDEIARAITVSLTHSLLGGSPKPGQARVPIDPDAYRKYLEGQSFSAKKTVEDDVRAIELLKEVTAAEPNFAPGFAALGRTYIHLNQLQPERGELAPAAQAALDEALRLDPHNIEAISLHLVMGLMKWDWKTATNDAHKLQAINARSVFTLRALNGYYGSLGFSEQQAAALREATRLDPLSFVDLNNLATVYNARGEYAEAASAASDALVLRPNRAMAIYTLCVADVGAKRLRDAQILIGQLLTLDEPGGADGCSLKNAAAEGNRAEAHRLAEEIAKRFPTFIFDETDMGEFFLASGDPANAMTWFQRAYARRNQYLLALSRSATTPPSLLNMPAWKALMQQPEARAWKSARDRLATELAGG